MVATAALVATAFAGGAAILERGRLSDTRAREQAMARVLSAPDARISTGTYRTGRLTVVYSVAQNRAVLTTTRLPRPAAGRTYQMWAINDAGPRSAGVLDPDDVVRPHSLLVCDLADAATIAMTVEPRGGSPQPTSDPVLTVDLRA